VPIYGFGLALKTFNAEVNTGMVSRQTFGL